VSLKGTRVHCLWPGGYITDASGIITHVSWRGDGTPGLFVDWDADVIGGQLRPRRAVRSTFVADAAWLVTVGGKPLDVPPRTVPVEVAGGVL
jgi:hypothetical protein